MSNTAGDLESSLSLLINLAGKMRMLSHRVALAAQQAVLSPTETQRATKIFDDALAEFNRTARALHDGDTGLGISHEAACHAQKAGATAPDITRVVDQFVETAGRLRSHLADGTVEIAEISAFTFFVADQLLAALNRITEAVGLALKGLFAQRQAHDTDARSAMLVAVRSIGEVSMKVKLISLNASIEAARAGDQGRGFAVIASEIRALSENATETSHQIASYLAKLA